MSRGGLCQGGLCPGGICLGSLCPEGVSVHGGVCPEGGLCPRGPCPGNLCQGDHPLYGNMWVVYMIYMCVFGHFFKLERNVCIPLAHIQLPYSS